MCMRQWAQIVAITLANSHQKGENCSGECGVSGSPAEEPPDVGRNFRLISCIL